jgi:hypothetical protein
MDPALDNIGYPTVGQLQTFMYTDYSPDDGFLELKV